MLFFATAYVWYSYILSVGSVQSHFVLYTAAVSGLAALPLQPPCQLV